MVVAAILIVGAILALLYYEVTFEIFYAIAGVALVITLTIGFWKVVYYLQAVL